MGSEMCIRDRGCTTSILAYSMAAKNGLNFNNMVKPKLTTVTGALMDVEGVMELPIRYSAASEIRKVLDRRNTGRLQGHNE